MPSRASPPHYAVQGHTITLFCTDGNASFRPTRDEMTRVLLGDGTVDYMQECTGDDPTLRAWKIKIGTFLAESVLNLPVAKGRQKYILSSLPNGYSLFVHKKGDRYNPRHDAYLRGSSTVTAFRSPAEFFFHAKWILLGCPRPILSEVPPLDEELFGSPLPEEYTDRCGCTYCDGVSQTYISQKFSNYNPKNQKKTRKVESPMQVKFEGALPSEPA